MNAEGFVGKAESPLLPRGDMVNVEYWCWNISSHPDICANRSVDLTQNMS